MAIVQYCTALFPVQPLSPMTTGVCDVPEFEPPPLTQVESWQVALARVSFAFEILQKQSPAESLRPLRKAIFKLMKEKDPQIHRAMTKSAGYARRLFSDESWTEWLEHRTALGTLASRIFSFAQGSKKALKQCDPELVRKANAEMKKLYHESSGCGNSRGSQNDPDLSSRGQRDIAFNRPTSDCSKMGRYDDPPNSQNLTVCGISESPPVESRSLWLRISGVFQAVDSKIGSWFSFPPGAAAAKESEAHDLCDIDLSIIPQIIKEQQGLLELDPIQFATLIAQYRQSSPYHQCQAQLQTNALLAQYRKEYEAEAANHRQARKDYPLGDYYYEEATISRYPERFRVKEKTRDALGECVAIVEIAIPGYYHWKIYRDDVWSLDPVVAEGSYNYDTEKNTPTVPDHHFYQSYTED